LILNLLYLYVAKLKFKNYSILDFEYVSNHSLRICLGIIGYLYLYQESPYNTSYLASRFIQPFNRVSKTNIQDFLEKNGYIIRHYPPKKDKIKELQYVNDENYKKEAKIYLLTNKLRTLREVILFDVYYTNLIDKNTHHLNKQYFNHYYHSYRNIMVNVPSNISNQLTPFAKMVLGDWGDPITKDYDTGKFGYDDSGWAGTHINIFTKINKETSDPFNTEELSPLCKELLKHTSLGEVVEIGILYSRPLLLADQLLKTIGANDYSNFYKKDRFKKLLIRQNKPQPNVYGMSKALFSLLMNYNIFTKITPQQFYSAIYGYEHIAQFKTLFPKAWDMLYRIKAGGWDGTPYCGFTFNLKMKIFKNDTRLVLKKDDPSFKRGQLYYKIVPLVIAMRQVEIMRQIWVRLKKCEIIFIPMEWSVIVSKEDENATHYITEQVLKHNIHKSLKFMVSKQYL
jgi:hypothetical protein